jgi:parallel beta-helix repeat protein
MIRAIWLALVAAMALFAVAPTTTSVTPTAGTGRGTQFTWTVTDTDGFANLAGSYLLINSTSAQTNACYVFVDTISDAIYIYDDAASLGSSFAVSSTQKDSSTSSLSNSQCTIYQENTRIVKTGNTVTVTLGVLFSASWTGAKNIYLAAYDGTTFVGPNDHGDWTVAAAATYYVSTSGSDGAAGTSTGAPWATLAKVAATQLAACDTVRFNRGNTWRESLTISYSGVKGCPITFTEYGSGAAPMFIGSTVMTGWVTHSGSIWKKTSVTTLPKMVFDNGTFMTRKESTAAMVANSFFMDDAADTLYVWLTSNADPTTGHSMEVSERPTPNGLGGLVENSTANNNDYLAFQFLALRYSNWFGFRFYGGSHITLDNNDIQYAYSNAIVAIGTGQGAPEQPLDYTVTYNNANHGGYARLEAGSAGKECISLDATHPFTIENNTFNDWYAECIVVANSAANGTIKYNTVTNMQLTGMIYLSGHIGTMHDIEVAYNYIDGCPNASTCVGGGLLVSIENAPGGGGDSNATIQDIKLHHNIIRNAPYAYCLTAGSDHTTSIMQRVEFAHNVAEGCFNGILLGGNANYTTNTFRNNIIYLGGAAGVQAVQITSANSTNNTFDNNVYYAPASAGFGFICLGTASSFATFKTNCAAFPGHEASGVEANPLFTNLGAQDYSLQSTSPAIGVATTLTGWQQERQGTAPDAGAYEYAPGKLGSSYLTKLRNRYKAVVYP